MVDINSLNVGDTLYIQTALYIDSPWRDVIGGRAVIREIDYKKKMINFRGFENTWYSLNSFDNQEELSERYGDQIAYRDI